MPKGTAIDMTSFNQGIMRLTSMSTKGAFVVALEKAAAFLIGRAMDHAPKDTGTLAGSGHWKRTGPTEVTLGFNTEYAYVQDMGSAKLKCKGYDSDIGPNLYFSGTLERCQETALKIIAAEIAKAMKK